MFTESPFEGDGMTRNTLASVGLVSLLAVQALQAQDKRRIAILDFEYGTVQGGLSAIFGTNVDVGRGIADIMVDRLVKSGTYSVIERKALEKVMAEQNFSNSNRADPSSAARLGKLLGVDAIVLGSVTQFGRDDKNTQVGGGALGGVTGRFGIGGVGRRESKAVVEISARMVNIDTGEVLLTSQGKGESTRGGTSLLGAGGSSVAAAGAGANMASANFGATILGEATNKAVTAVATEFDQNVARVPHRTIPLDGLVADVSGNTLVLNVGTKNGLRVGDKLVVFRTGREIRDPGTGKVLRRTETNVGSIAVTEVDEGSAVGTFEGSEAAKVGDHVKR
jgi:curli biogenesis system outer membrane secretion channel CsgG